MLQHDANIQAQQSIHDNRLKADGVEEAVISLLPDISYGRGIDLLVGLDVTEEIAHAFEGYVRLISIGDTTPAHNVVDDLVNL